MIALCHPNELQAVHQSEMMIEDFGGDSSREVINSDKLALKAKSVKLREADRFTHIFDAMIAVIPGVKYPIPSLDSHHSQCHSRLNGHAPRL
jgi:hypothetical protein